MTNHFESPFKGKLLSDDVTNRNIKVGRYSYYSGYYHGHSRPNRFTVKTSLRLVICIILPHHTRAANWQKFKRIPCFSFFKTEKSRPHTKGKFMYCNLICFCQ